MGIYGFDPVTGHFTHAFEGFTALEIPSCAAANDLESENLIALATAPDMLRERWNGTAVVLRDDLPVVDPRAVMSITPRQLFIALASPPWNFITAEEAVSAAATGALPANVETAIAALDPASEMAARVTWARMQEVRRTDPLVALMAATQPGLTDDTLDDFFAFARNL